MTDFNAEDLLNTQVSGEMSTKYTPVPEGEWRATIKEIKGRATNKGQSIMDILWEVTDPQVEAVTGMTNSIVRQSIFLDISPSGGLDVSKGKNIGLGKLRAAVGQNGPGPWSPGMLSGSVAIIRVEHRHVDEDVYADVKGVAAA